MERGIRAPIFLRALCAHLRSCVCGKGHQQPPKAPAVGCHTPRSNKECLSPGLSVFPIGKSHQAAPLSRGCGALLKTGSPAAPASNRQRE
jgi:hypothetical protein